MTIDFKDPKATTSLTGREVITRDKNDVLHAPDNVIKSDQGARTMIKRMASAHLKRVYTYNRVAGMFDGNPPYNPQRMKANNITDRANVNTKDAAAVLEAYTLSLWSLFNDVRFMADFQVSLTDDKGQNAYFGQVLSEEFDRVIKLWPAWKREMEFHQLELVKIGLNAVVFFDEEDWRFKPIKYIDTFLSDRAPTNIEDVSAVAFDRTFTVQYLFKTYEKFKDRKDGKWDAEALGEILFQLAERSDDKYSSLTGFNEIQRAIRNNEVQYEDLYADSIHFLSIFQKEYDGKISHVMIHRDIESKNGKAPFFFDRQYENMSQCVHFFTLKPGEEYLYGAKGLGQAIFSCMEALTRLDCSAIDQGMRAGSMIVKSGVTRGTEQRLIKFQHGGIIDVGETSLEQNKFGDNLGGTINLAQYLRQKVFANNNMSGLDPQAPDRDRGTKHAEVQATKEARIQKNTISHYYDQLDPLFCEIVRKMLNAKTTSPGYQYAKMWKDRCIKRGVPPELFAVMKQDLSPNGLPQYIEVYATRASGSGSQIADQTEVRACMSIITTLGERGRKAVLMDYITAFRGYRYVDRYFPPEDQQQQPVVDDTIASIENNLLADGKQIVVSPDSNHAVHAASHIRMMNDAMQQYQQTPSDQLDFAMLDKLDHLFAASGPHLTRHLLFLSQDTTRQQEMAEYRAKWAILSNFGDMIKNNAQKAREGQINQQQKQASQVSEVQGKLQIADMKAQGEVANQATKIKNDYELGRQRERNKYLLKSDELNNNHYIKGMATLHDMALDAAKELADSGNDAFGTPPTQPAIPPIGGAPSEVQ